MCGGGDINRTNQLLSIVSVETSSYYLRVAKASGARLWRFVCQRIYAAGVLTTRSLRHDSTWSSSRTLILTAHSDSGHFPATVPDRAVNDLEAGAIIEDGVVLPRPLGTASRGI